MLWAPTITYQPSSYIFCIAMASQYGMSSCLRATFFLFHVTSTIWARLGFTVLLSRYSEAYFHLLTMGNGSFQFDFLRSVSSKVSLTISHTDGACTSSPVVHSSFQSWDKSHSSVTQAENFHFTNLPTVLDFGVRVERSLLQHKLKRIYCVIIQSFFALFVSRQSKNLKFL